MRRATHRGHLPGITGERLLQDLLWGSQGIGLPDADEPPCIVAQDDVPALLDAAFAHGLMGQLYQRLHSAPDWEAQPLSLRERLDDYVLLTVGRSQHRRATAEAITTGLYEAGIASVLLKGTVLAHSVFEHAWLRPSADIDVLVAPEDVTETNRVLSALGYRAAPALEDPMASYQRAWLPADASALAHSIDLHWRLSNRQLVAKTIAPEVLLSRSKPLEAVGANARKPNNAALLIHAALHRAVHLKSPYVAGEHVLENDRLLWLLDLCLIAESMSESDWSEAVEICAKVGVGPIVADGIRTAFALLGSQVSPVNTDTFETHGNSLAALALIKPGRPWGIVSDLLSLESSTQRIRLLKGHLFPSSHYMRETYAPQSTLPLPALYLVRLAHGFHKRLRHQAPKKAPDLGTTAD